MMDRMEETEAFQGRIWVEEHDFAVVVGMNGTRLPCCLWRFMILQSTHHAICPKSICGNNLAMNTRGPIAGGDETAPERETTSSKTIGRTADRARRYPSGIPRLTDRSTLSLSFLQERLWLLGQLEPESAAYQVPFALRLTGPLDEGALRQTLQTIIDRHDILRTRITTHDGQPAPVVSPRLALDLRIIELNHLPSSEREAHAKSLATEEALRPFDLVNEPGWRATLLRLGEQDHVLHLVFHHIIYDASSRQVFREEFATLYRALRTGSLPWLPELPIQYWDFAHWQRHRPEGELLERQRSYWKSQLTGCLPVDLPTDHARPSIPSRRGGRAEVTLPEPLTGSLKALGRQGDATPFMVLLAAFQMLLWRYTGSEDILVASMAAGRNWVETERLIGLFLNSFVLRTNLSSNPTFRELLGRVRETCRGAYSHQDLPFEQLLGILRSKRDINPAPFFQVVFNFENMPEKRVDVADLTVTEFEFEFPVTPSDLTVEILPQGRELKCVFAYNADLFDQGTIERMAGHYRTLLEGIVAEPDCRIASLPLLTPAERHQILVDWNRTEVDYPRDATLQGLFEAQAQRRPDAVALKFAGQSLTYGELNRQANRWAHRLVAGGVALETRVGLLVERSLDAIVGLLAILKAGGACVPLDPAYPKERLGFMLEDAGIHLLLTDGKLECALPQQDRRIVRLDSWGNSGPGDDDQNPHLGARPDHVAYVYYTSGSTGTPKGVEVLHRGIVRLICGSDFAHFGPDEVFLQLSSISFDASALEIWAVLLHGGRCVLFPHRVPDMAQLGTLLKQEGITLLWLTPSFFNALIDASPHVLSGVRQVLVGGEALSVPHICRALSLLPNTQLVNGYGPTESAVLACCYRIPRTQSPAARSIPIGRPIANTQVYILDPSLQPVPVGVAGEMYIGGDGLACGYLNRPQVTSQKFISDPFSAEAGARLYKTGDSCRYLPDGKIEFLGRLDNMVKLRGFRIELGEIESSLVEHPAVSAAALVVREDDHGDKRLVAYVVPHQRAIAPNPKDLRDFLKAKLPEYMLPTDFFDLEALPVTPNGKVDRRALPVMSRTRQGQKGYVPPRDIQEVQLTKIWEDILEVRPIGLEDDFFDLGGHSLLALRMMSRIEDVYGKALPLATLFDQATIKHLVECLRTESLKEVHSAIVPVQSGGSCPPLFFLHGDLWGGLYCRKLARLLGQDQPFYGVMPNGFDGRPLLPTIEAMAEENIRLLMAFQPQGPYLLGGYCNGGLVAYEMARQLEQRGLEVGILVLLDTGVPRYFGWLKAIVRGGALTGLNPDAQMRVYAYLRKYVVMIQNAYHRGYKALLALFWQSARRKALRLLGTPPEDLGIPGPVFEDPLQSKRYEHLVRALFNYRPQPYHGRMLLLRTSIIGGSPATDRTAGWGKIVPRLEVLEIPGNHATCLTEHAETVAEHISKCLGVFQAEA